MPALNIAALRESHQKPAGRPAALEEIVTSEEEVLNAYDPNDEERNCQMPPNRLKHLQMDYFRRECSEVVQGAVFISGYRVASDVESLRKHQITHIVNTAADVCDSCFPDQFSYVTYYLKDANWEDISLLFYRTLEWMQNAISRGGRVLVHCREGVSRSATMVIAYLMWKFNASFENAHQMLQKVRPICNPNPGFIVQLLLLGKRLSGESSCGNLPGGKSPKPDLPSLFRVAPHHPKEPFLLLMPVDWTGPHLPPVDPRFGWVIQRGPQLVLWVGSRVPDVAEVRETVTEYARRLEKFERCQCNVRVVPEGEEPALWQLLGLQTEPADCSNLVAVRPAYDADFEVIQTLTAQANAAGVATEGQQDFAVLRAPPLVGSDVSDAAMPAG